MNHVEKHPGGASMCRHCGGEVGEDGYSMGGMVEAMEMVNDDDFAEEPQQGVDAEKMSDEAFVNTIRRRKGSR